MDVLFDTTNGAGFAVALVVPFHWGVWRYWPLVGTQAMTLKAKIAYRLAKAFNWWMAIGLAACLAFWGAMIWWLT